MKLPPLGDALIKGIPERAWMRGLPLELIPDAGTAGDCPAAEGLLRRLRPDTIVLAHPQAPTVWKLESHLPPIV